MMGISNAHGGHPTVIVTVSSFVSLSAVKANSQAIPGLKCPSGTGEAGRVAIPTRSLNLRNQPVGSPRPLS